MIEAKNLLFLIHVKNISRLRKDVTLEIQRAIFDKDGKLNIKTENLTLNQHDEYNIGVEPDILNAISQAIRNRKK